MKLSNKTLQTIIKGSYQFRDVGNGYMSFSHYDDAQYKYLQFKEFFSTRAIFSSSVRVEFITDATEIGFDYKLIYFGSRDSFDVYCDGVCTNVTYVKGLEPKGKLSFTLPEGKKKVVLYFPLDLEMGVKNFRIEGKWRKTSGKEPKVLWMGDSITQGYGVSTTGNTYVNITSRELGYDVLNQGIGGYYYDEKVVTPMDGYTPDKIIIAMGTNQHKSADKKERVEKFYETLSKVYPSVPVLTITPLWRGDAGYNSEAMAELKEIINTTCAKYPNIKVVDGFELVPHVSEYYIDNLHPNSLGALTYSNNLVKKIKALKF